jgi:hypothetical protein
MPTSYAALCDDFYINQRVGLKMDLPLRRDSALSMFDRLRREHPTLARFRKQGQELSLESGDPASVLAATMTEAPPDNRSQSWVALRKTSVRSGSVNPESMTEGYALHRLVLEVAPYFLDISSLDIEFVELLMGFDLHFAGNHDEVVYQALMADSPIGALARIPGALPVDCQPSFGVALNGPCNIHAHMEVKTRSSPRGTPRSGEFREEPISVYVTLRRYGPYPDIGTLPEVLDELARHAESIADERAIPGLINPLRAAIASGNV